MREEPERPLAPFARAGSDAESAKLAEPGAGTGGILIEAAAAAMLPHTGASGRRRGRSGGPVDPAVPARL